MKIQRMIMVVITFCSFGIANAGDVSGLTTFTAGTKAVASQVNGNFNAVKTAVDDNNARIAALEARIAELEANTVLSLDGKVFFQTFNGTPEVRFHGVNVKITNEVGTTDSINGVGNLIIGYNAARSALSDKTGSHNLVVGDNHNYSSYGGLVAGHENAVEARNASVSGGEGNAARGDSSSVSGGKFNRTIGNYSSVSGGINNEASGQYSSITGGSNNSATATNSSVTGGLQNSADGQQSSVSGGQNNVATSGASSILGGDNQETTGGVETIPALP